MCEPRPMTEPAFAFWSTYERLGLPVWATPREVLRAGQRKLKGKVRYSQTQRGMRHNFYRDLLDCHRRAREIYRVVQAGDFSGPTTDERD